MGDSTAVHLARAMRQASAAAAAASARQSRGTACSVSTPSDLHWMPGALELP